MAAGGGGEGAEEGGRERGGRLPPASVRRGSAPASERKQSPAPPPRPLLPLLSQQRGVRHRVALRRRVTPLASLRPAPPPLRGERGDPTARPGPRSAAPRESPSGFRLRFVCGPTPVNPAREEGAASSLPREALLNPALGFAAGHRDAPPSLNLAKVAFPPGGGDTSRPPWSNSGKSLAVELTFLLPELLNGNLFRRNL